MALAAKLPLVMASGAYNKKIMYMGYTIPYEKLKNSSFEEVMQEIQDYYIKNDIQPKIAENWNPQIY